eukprot:gene38380-10107_t
MSDSEMAGSGGGQGSGTVQACDEERDIAATLQRLATPSLPFLADMGCAKSLAASRTTPRAGGWMDRHREGRGSRYVFIISKAAYLLPGVAPADLSVGLVTSF